MYHRFSKPLGNDRQFVLRKQTVQVPRSRKFTLLVFTAHTKVVMPGLACATCRTVDAFHVLVLIVVSLKTKFSESYNFKLLLPNMLRTITGQIIEHILILSPFSVVV